jgi:hypothetical protein
MLRLAVLEASPFHFFYQDLLTTNAFASALLPQRATPEVSQGVPAPAREYGTREERPMEGGFFAARLKETNDFLSFVPKNERRKRKGWGENEEASSNYIVAFCFCSFCSFVRYSCDFLGIYPFDSKEGC